MGKKLRFKWDCLGNSSLVHCFPLSKIGVEKAVITAFLSSFFPVFSAVADVVEKNIVPKDAFVMDFFMNETRRKKAPLILEMHNNDQNSSILIPYSIGNSTLNVVMYFDDKVNMRNGYLPFISLYYHPYFDGINIANYHDYKSGDISEIYKRVQENSAGKISIGGRKNKTVQHMISVVPKRLDNAAAIMWLRELEDNKEQDVHELENLAKEKNQEGEKNLVSISNNDLVAQRIALEVKKNRSDLDFSTGVYNYFDDGFYSKAGAIGSKNVESLLCANSNNVMCIGVYSRAEGMGSVALGYESEAIRGPNVAGYDPVTGNVSTTNDYIWKSTYGEIGIGNMNYKVSRQITGVAAGRQDNEAVNVAQLKALRDWMVGKDTSSLIQFRKHANFFGYNEIAIAWDIPDYTGVMNVGTKDGVKRTIRGVRDASLSETSDHAVTGKQLWVTNEKVKTLETSVNAAVVDIVTVKNYTASLEVDMKNSMKNISQYLGGSADISSNIAPMYKIQGKTYRDIGAAFVGIDGSFTDLYEKILNMSSAKDLLVQYHPGSVKIVEDKKPSYISIGQDVETDLISVAASNGDKRILSGVKSGTISQFSTEAVNGAQLWKTEGNLSQYLGGNGDISNGIAPTYEIQGQTYRDVGSAFVGIDQFFTNIKTHITDDIQQRVLLWSDSEDAFVALHAEGEGKKQKKSKLKFLLDGDVSEASTEAITGHQLYMMNNQLASYFGGGAGYDNGQWLAPSFNVIQFSGNGSRSTNKIYNNVSDAFDGISKAVADVNDRLSGVEQETGQSALNWNKETESYDASYKDKPSVITNVADGKITEGSKDAVNGGQLWEAKDDIKKVQNQVNNLEDKVNDFNDKLSDIGNSVDDMKDIIKDVVAKDGSVNYDKDGNGKKTNTITLKGGNESEPVVIDNVADGKIENGSKQAINGGQLHDYAQEQVEIIFDKAKKYTDKKVKNVINEAVSRAKDYTDMKFNTLNYGIENATKEARQAAAISLAVSNLRYNDTPGKLSVAFGSGLWRSQSALSFGTGYTSEDGNILSNFSATSAGGYWGIGAGLSITLN
ncbi:Vomp family autotransporter [Bartonella ancashensis]|uniref:Surface protein/Bartonella adhesin n=1 Tax=Bartonella ancashensis TaxID=1318743 RepID=A0A0M4LKT9_9HYPH|nr:Vomp family autotransporter [Bartonella ancashensis]ALE04152.1 Surface protein/Bartonella adhesin [Bartonella ancashensis]